MELLKDVKGTTVDRLITLGEIAVITAGLAWTIVNVPEYAWPGLKDLPWAAIIGAVFTGIGALSLGVRRLARPAGEATTQRERDSVADSQPLEK
jgi:hypothetical protein